MVGEEKGEGSKHPWKWRVGAPTWKRVLCRPSRVNEMNPPQEHRVLTLFFFLDFYSFKCSAPCASQGSYLSEAGPSISVQRVPEDNVPPSLSEVEKTRRSGIGKRQGWLSP